LERRADFALAVPSNRPVCTFALFAAIEEERSPRASHLQSGGRLLGKSVLLA
jgi:hypothetical protein